MKILVTGGAGFIGSHIVDAMIHSKHQVEVLDNLSTGFAHNIPTGITLFNEDIGNPAAAEIVQNGGYDTIFHQAAQIDVRKSVQNPAEDAHINIIGTINLLEAAVKSGVQHFIFASSGGAGYGEPDYYPLDEKHLLNPLSPYGISKIAVEKYLHYYQEVHGLKTTILRYANVYGPRQNPHGEAGVVAIFLNKMLQNQQPLINGDGKQTRDYVYVADVVNANTMVFNNKKYGAYNVGTGREITVNEIFEVLNTFFENKFSQQHGQTKSGEQRRSVLSYQKIKQEFGWEPTIDLETGLYKTYQWFASVQNK